MTGFTRGARFRAAILGAPIASTIVFEEFLLSLIPLGGTLNQADDPGSLLPNDITIGLPFSGTVTYNTSRFNDPTFFYRAYNGVDTWNIAGPITAITPVPEPATAAFAIAARLLGFALIRAKRGRLPEAELECPSLAVSPIGKDWSLKNDPCRLSRRAETLRGLSNPDGVLYCFAAVPSVAGLGALNHIEL